MAEDGTNQNLPEAIPVGGGRGSLARVLSDLADPHRARGTAGLLITAIQTGTLDLFSIDYGTVRREATLLAKSEDARAKAAGTKLLVAMALHDARLIEAADKAARLDGGSPTEINEHTTYIKGVDESQI